MALVTDRPSPNRRPRAQPPRRSARVLALAAVCLFIAAVVVIVVRSTSSTKTAKAKHAQRKASTPKRAPNPASSPTAPGLVAQQAAALQAPVQDPAGAALDGGSGLLIGGLDPSDSSVSTIHVVRRSGDSTIGDLSTPLHDAAAASLGGFVYLFGGGQLGSRAEIVRIDPHGGQTTPAGTLPQPRSDIAAAAIGGTVYIVGGYDGQQSLDTILAWQPGSAARVVGTLPYALRYAAVAAASGRVLIAGGTTPNGPSAQILSFDPSTGKVQSVGALPTPTTHAAAAALGGYVYVIGGRNGTAGPQTRAIVGIGRDGTKPTSAGLLPKPLSDAAAIPISGDILVAGGRTPDGVVADVLALTPGAIR